MFMCVCVCVRVCYVDYFLFNLIIPKKNSYTASKVDKLYVTFIYYFTPLLIT